MTDCIVKVGEKLHISNRRNFVGAARRTFIGEVIATQGNVVRMEGWLFIYNPDTQQYCRKDSLMTKIIGLSNGFNHITVLPSLMRIENLAYETRNGDLVITDGVALRFDATEAGPGV